MRRMFIFFFMIIIITNIYSEGERDITQPEFLEAQYKVVNLTDDPIVFYVNRFYYGTEIQPGNEYYTLRKQLKPRISEYFIIQKKNEDPILYTFSSERYKGVYQYHIVITKENVFILNCPFNKDIDYLDSYVLDKYKAIWWHRKKWTNDDVKITIVNKTDRDASVYLYDPYKDLYEYYIFPRDKIEHNIKLVLFQLTPVNLVINTNVGFVFEGYNIDIRNGNVDILVEFDENGYGVRYQE